MISTTKQEAVEVESALQQYERARTMYGEDSLESRKLRERLEEITVAGEGRPDPETNGNFPITK